MGFFNSHFDLNPFNGGFDPTPFFGLGATAAAGNVAKSLNSVGQSGKPNSYGGLTSQSQGGSTGPATLVVHPANVHDVYTPMTNSAGGGGGGQVLGSSVTRSSAPAVNPNQALMDLINASLGRMPGELATAQANIHKQYDVNNNELQSGFNTAKQNYDSSTQQNQQAYQTNKNQIQDQAATGLEGLLRVLGAHGAGGSSTALYQAPNAVAGVAAQQNAGAGQTYGQNQQALDTNFNIYQTGFNNSKKQLADWLTGQLQDAQNQSNANEQQLRENMLSLSPTVAAAQEQVAHINSLRDAADRLQSFNPTYNGVTPTYTAPSISSYEVTPNSVGQTQANGTPGSLTPAIASLLGLGKDKNRQPFGFGA